MRLKEWLDSRQTPGTIAYTARRLVDSGGAYHSVEKNFRALYILEALARNDGIPQAAATSIGVHVETVRLLMRSLGISKKEVQRLSERLRGAQ